jgi:glucose-6-phosphate-specific signal transduction histidine kinase
MAYVNFDKFIVSISPSPYNYEMEDTEYQRAQQTISTLQTQLGELRQSTYKTVHDDIGSTLSTASIKAKVLTDKISNESDKHYLLEVHKLIRETLDQVTILNKKLKSVWIPQTIDTFFESLEKEFSNIQAVFPIQIKFEIFNRSELKKQSLATLSVMHSFTEQYIKDAISRLTQELIITVTITKEKITWSFADSSPQKPTQKNFDNLNEKISSASGIFSIQESTSTLIFPNQGAA